MLEIRREADDPQRRSLKIFDAFGNWVATIKLLDAENGAAMLGCIGGDRIKFLRDEVKYLKGKQGKRSLSLEPKGAML